MWDFVSLINEHNNVKKDLKALSDRQNILRNDYNKMSSKVDTASNDIIAVNNVARRARRDNAQNAEK